MLFSSSCTTGVVVARRAFLRRTATLLGMGLLPGVVAACGGTPSLSVSSASTLATSAAATSAGPSTTNAAATSRPSASIASAAATSSSGVVKSGGTHLVFLDPDNATLGDIKTKAVAAYNSQTAGVSVERVYGEGAKTYEKLQAMIAGGTSPDIFWSWGYWLSAAASKGALRAFDDYVAREPTNTYVSTWSPAAKDSGQFAGKLFGFTTQLGVPGIYVNEDMFKSSDVALPPADYSSTTWTLDAFVQSARTLTRNGPDGLPQQFGANMWGLWWAGFNWIIEAFGGAVFDPQHRTSWLDHQEDIDAVTWLADLALKEHVAPTSAQNKNNAFAFDAGKSAMLVNWAHAAADHAKTIGSRFTWNLYPLPRGAKLTVAGASFNWYCLPLDGKQPDPAWQFVRSMASPGTVQNFLAQGVSFPYMSSGQDAMWQDFPKLNKKMAIEAMPLLAIAPLLPRDPEIETAMKKEINPAFDGQRSVREAMLAAKQVVTPLL